MDCINQLKSSSSEEDQMEMMMQLPEFCGAHSDLPPPELSGIGIHGTMPPHFIDNPPMASSASFSTLPSTTNTISFTMVQDETPSPWLSNLGKEELSGGKSYDTGTASDKGSSMAAMREMIFRIAAMQPIHIDPDSVKPPKRRNVKISKDPQSVAARHRRERISERIRILQRLVPGGTKMDTASMLDEAIHYVKFLKTQVQSLERAAAMSSGTVPSYLPLVKPNYQALPPPNVPGYGDV